MRIVRVSGRGGTCCMLHAAYYAVYLHTHSARTHIHMYRYKKHENGTESVGEGSVLQSDATLLALGCTTRVCPSTHTRTHRHTHTTPQQWRELRQHWLRRPVVRSFAAMPPPPHPPSLPPILTSNQPTSPNLHPTPLTQGSETGGYRGSIRASGGG